MKPEIKTCEHCGASLRKNWHKLTPLLVTALLKFHRAVKRRGENKVHYIHDMTDEPLTISENKNWSKLRFHGLIAKYRENGKHKSGYWVLTRRGAQFLRGEIRVPYEVLTFRNRVENHSLETVSIEDVWGGRPYVEQIDDIEYETAELPGDGRLL